MSTEDGAGDYLVVAGDLIVVGKQPDGDSVRFIADDRTLLPTLLHGDRLRVSTDGSVQLRFDGVDAPELHYQGAAQPLGAASRDALLAHVGFTSLTYAADGETVTGSDPGLVRAVVLAAMVEVNGRPVAFVLTGEPAAALVPSGGQHVTLSSTVLDESENVWLLATGAAYPLSYTSTDPAIREQMVAVGAQARTAGVGVWAVDSSARFELTDQAAIGPDGVLIFPKLFRRATDYLRETTSDGDGGGRVSLPDWLAANADQDDEVVVAGADPVPLHTLLTEVGTTVTLGPDLLDLVFVER